MRSFGTRLLTLLFIALVLQCALDGPSPFTPPQEDSTFCAILNSGSLEMLLPAEARSYASAGNLMGPLPDAEPLWLAAPSVDHPPELHV